MSIIITRKNTNFMLILLILYVFLILLAMKKSLIAALLPLALLFSCQNPEQDQEPSFTFPEGKTPAYEFSYAGGSQKLEFASALDWSVSVSEAGKDWVSFDENEGKAGNSSLVITAAQNDGEGERDCRITLFSESKAKSLSVAISIHQYQKDEIILDPKTVNIPATGGDFSVKLSFNVNITTEISESWIHSVATKALKDSVARFSADPNTSTVERTGKVRFFNSVSNIESILTVVQAAGEDPGPSIDNAFTRNCTKPGIYNLKNPDAPESIQEYEEFTDQIAFGTDNKVRTFRIQNLKSGRITGMVLNSTVFTVGETAGLTLTTTVPTGTEKEEYTVRTDRYSSGKLWLEDLEAGKGFIITVE